MIIPILQTQPLDRRLPLLRNVLAEDQLPLLTLVMALDSFGLMLVAPSALPPDRTAVLRQAFADMSVDPDYKAEAVKLGQPATEAIRGDRLALMMAQLAGAATPEIVTAYKRLSSGR